VIIIMRILAIMILSPVLCSNFAAGQDVWQLPMPGSSVSVEYISPSLKSFTQLLPEISMYSIIATATIQLQSGNKFIFEIPYIHYHRDKIDYVLSFMGYTYVYTVFEYTTGNIGNIYLGYEIVKKDSHFSTTLGVYLPTGSNKGGATNAGALYDYDQFGLYSADYLTLQPRFNFNLESDNYFMDIKGSPTFLISTKSKSSTNRTDIFLMLSLRAGFLAGNFIACTEWAENFLVTESGDFSDRFIHQAGFVAGYKFGPFQPEIFYRFPLSTNISNFLNSVVGISAGYSF
jgi:hypothetical protein